ncbi:MAG: GNAT family N-acetyltransferase [Sphingobacteriales bacterium]|nr:MAG: GNAT family N-acetyltransferase [Sphingobacteriales bacterium]
MDNIEIIRATPNNVAQLQEISIQTFSETFSATNDEQHMKKYLDESFATEKLTAELNNPESEFYFATVDDKVVGYLKVNFGQAQTELKDDTGVEIERIYVLQEFYGKKVGQILYDKAIEIARQLNAIFVWLGVWEENHRALAFYRKNGFIPFDKHIFRLGDDEQTDIMMKLEL